MKKYGLAVSCLICGLLLGLGVQTFAADGIKHVTASINETFRFIVDGEEKNLPDDYEVLVYDNHTYLPVRALSNMTGIKVDWDDMKKIINLTTPAVVDNDQNEIEYATLPVTKENSEFTLSVVTFTEDIQDHYKKLYLRLESRKENSIFRIAPSETTYEIDGITYDYRQTEIAYWDDRWYTSYAEKERPLEGYFLLPKDVQDAEKVHIEITVMKDTDSGSVPEIVEFNLALSH